MPELRQQLEHCLAGRVCFLGLGNPDYGDDGLGIRLSEMLCHAGMANVLTAGITPERHLATLARQRFEHVVFLDAVEFGGAPGSVVFLDAGAIAARFPQVSTHKISLGLLAQWAEANGMKAWLLGVEPESLKPSPEGQPLTAAIRVTLEALSALLQSLQLSPVLPSAAPASALKQIVEERAS
jgi:hydrogenase 3 maturation protease